MVLECKKRGRTLNSLTFGRIKLLLYYIKTISSSKSITQLSKEHPHSELENFSYKICFCPKHLSFWSSKKYRTENKNGSLQYSLIRCNIFSKTLRFSNHANNQTFFSGQNLDYFSQYPSRRGRRRNISAEKQNY